MFLKATKVSLPSVLNVLRILDIFWWFTWSYPWASILVSYSYVYYCNQALHKKYIKICHVFLTQLITWILGRAPIAAGRPWFERYRLHTPHADAPATLFTPGDFMMQTEAARYISESLHYSLILSFLDSKHWSAVTVNSATVAISTDAHARFFVNKVQLPKSKLRIVLVNISSLLALQAGNSVSCCEKWHMTQIAHHEQLWFTQW